MQTWTVQIHGGPNENSFEISVINLNGKGFYDAQLHYGWFDKNKLLISHCGGPCQNSVNTTVWNKLIRIAMEVADELNHDSIQAIS
jgi:hypothetical protein